MVRMTRTATLTAAFALISVAGALSPVAAEPCTGPFRQCAIEVNATCSRDADGVQRIDYWNFGGNAKAQTQN